MSPQVREVDATEALRALADQVAAGAQDRRLDLAVDTTTRAAVDALAAEIGGHGARSKAARLMLQEGAKALVSKRRRRA